MVEATSDENATATAVPTATGGSVNLNLASVDKANALGLFREAELNTHVDIVLAAYIAESLKVAQVSSVSAITDIVALNDTCQSHWYSCRKTKISRRKSSRKTWRRLVSMSLRKDWHSEASITTCYSLECLVRPPTTPRISLWAR